MTKMQVIDDFFPMALRKLFNGPAVPLNISIEEVNEAREWKTRLDRDIMKILDGLENEQF